MCHICSDIKPEILLFTCHDEDTSSYSEEHLINKKNGRVKVGNLYGEEPNICASSLCCGLRLCVREVSKWVSSIFIPDKVPISY